MKHVISKTAVTVAAVATLGALAAPAASAAPRVHPHLTSVTAFTLLNSRGDSGAGGNDWATDTIVRALHITQTGGTPGAYTFVATVSDSGSFVTIPHVLSPNQGPTYTGTVIAAKVNGTLSGHASYSFTASRLPQPNLVPTQESGTPTSGPRTTSLWFEQSFPAGTSFTGGINNDWSWGYATSCNVRVPGGYVVTHEHWTDDATGNGQLPVDGNIDGECLAV